MSRAAPGCSPARRRARSARAACVSKRDRLSAAASTSYQPSRSSNLMTSRLDFRAPGRFLHTVSTQLASATVGRSYPPPKRQRLKG
jgi:hypothetical protein